MGQRVEFLSAVLVVSKDAEALAAFYRDVLGLPLHREQRGDTERGDTIHWACALGDLHFAIHPVDDFDDDPPDGTSAVKLAFGVADIDEVAARLEEQGVELVYPPRDLGWCKMTAVRDPDGNYIELTELGDDWFRHLEKRKVDATELLSSRHKKLEALDDG